MKALEVLALILAGLVAIGDHLHFWQEYCGRLDLWIVSRVGWRQQWDVPPWFRWFFPGGALLLGYLTMALVLWSPVLGMAATAGRVIADRLVIHRGLWRLFRDRGVAEWAPKGPVAGTDGGWWQVPAGGLAAALAVALLASGGWQLAGEAAAIFVLPAVIFGGFATRVALYADWCGAR